MPSQPWFVAQGRSESSAVSAMQPAASSKTTSAAARASPHQSPSLGKDGIALLHGGLLPIAQNVGDDEVLAGHRLTEPQTANVRVGRTDLAANAEVKARQRILAVLAEQFLDGTIGELDDGEHVLVVDLDDLALVAGRERVDARRARRGRRRLRLSLRLYLLEELLQLLVLLLLLGEVLLGGLGLVLRGGDLVLERGDLAIEVLDLALDLGDLILGGVALLLGLLDLALEFLDLNLALTRRRLQLVVLADELLELPAKGRQLGASRVERGLLRLARSKSCSSNSLAVP